MSGCINLHQRSIQKNVWSPKRPNGCLGKTVRTDQTCFLSTLNHWWLKNFLSQMWFLNSTQTPENFVQLPPEPLQLWGTHGLPRYTAPELSTV